MRAFVCDSCGLLLFFENSSCVRCGAAHGIAASRLDLVTLAPGSELRHCANAQAIDCNWLLEPGEPGELCRSCRLTRTRPAAGDAEGVAMLARAEAAKRRALFGLLDVGLPVQEGRLWFDLLSSRVEPVTTGHSAGVITLDLAESDDAERERRRVALGEPYRTLLGHFRHELAHYYEPILVDGTGARDAFRARFGDERADYDAALRRHYEQGAPPAWSESHVSAYAAVHPWEDWAETFAHYVHIRDTLQTAGAFGMLVVGPAETRGRREFMAVPDDDPGDETFHDLLANWLPLTYALNAVNRSMGAGDLYPFTLAPRVIEKLAFVHGRVAALG